MKRKILWCLVIIADILFLAYFAILSVNARPHFDDLSFLSMLRDMSIPEYIHTYYMGENGAFISYFANAILFSGINFIGGTKLLPLIWIILGMTICCFACYVYAGNFSWKRTMPIVALLYSIYVFVNFDSAISYWLCGMSYCLSGPIVLLLFSFVNKKKSKAIDWVMVAFLSFWLGGGNASLSCVNLATLGLNALLLLSVNNWKISSAFQDVRGKKVILALCVILLAFVIVVIAPGNYVRLNSAEFETMSRPDSLLQWVVKCVKCMVMFCYFSAFNILWYAVVGALAWVIGRMSEKKLQIGRKATLCIVVFWLLELLLYSMPQSFLFGSFGYQRVWTPMTFVNIVCLVAVFFLLGNTSKKGTTLGVCASYAGLILLSCIIGWHITADAKTVRDYSKKYDARWATLASVPEDREETIVLEKLETPYTTDLKYDLYQLLGRKKNPQPELYYVPDSSPDFHSRALREYFNIKAKIEIVDSSVIE